MNTLALSIVLDSLIISNNGNTTLGLDSTNIYPNFDPNDPWPAKNRGYYFQNTSYLTTSLIFSPTFTFNSWIKIITKGILAKKSNLFIIDLSSPHQFQILLNNSSYLNISYSIPLNSWLFLSISTSLSWISIYINQRRVSITSILSIFYDNQNENLIISNSTSGITGFIYSIEIYNQADWFELYINSSCPSTSFCLSNCNINQDPFNNSCKNCSNYCQAGCYENKCNLCQNDICFECYTYNNCFACKENSAFVNNTCVCNNGYFFNTTTELCEICFSSCLTCNETYCLSCPSNYYLDSGFCIECPIKCAKCNGICIECIINSILINNECTCKLGFYGDNCAAVTLNATLTAAGSTLSLIFSDALQNDLQSSDIEIIVAALAFTSSLVKINSCEYQIILTIIGAYPSTLVTLFFTNSIISVNNALLTQNNYSITINQSNNYQGSVTMNSTKTTYSKVSTYSIAAITTISVSNPAALWSYINTIQLLCFIPLSGINLPSETKGMLIGLRSYYLFPNSLTYFYNGGSSITDTHETELDFTSNSVILNNGKQVTAFLFFLFYYFFFYLFSKINFGLKFINEFNHETILEFKYGFFLRFAIQNYLECCISCLLGLYTAMFTTVDLIINFIVAIILGVIFYLDCLSFISSILLLYCGKKSK